MRKKEKNGIVLLHLLNTLQEYYQKWNIHHFYHDLIRALKYLDETRPALKIDDPTLINSNQQGINFSAFPDGNGYYMDYDLTTDGKVNDLTLQVEFRKEGNGYIVLLDDLHTM